MSAKGFLIFCVAIFGVASAAKIPEYIHICKRNDPHVSKCIRDSVEVLRPRLKKGIPELEVPGLEPLHISDVVIASGNDASNFKAILKDIDVYGASAFQITKLKVDLQKNIYRVGLKIPILKLIGNYDVDARVLVVPIKGTGTFKANATNCEGQGILKAEIVERNGHRAFHFLSFDLALKIGDYSIHLDNLFNGDPILSQAANEVINQNKAEFIEASLPFVQRKVSEILLEIADKITLNLDYDEAFPEK